MPVLTYRDLKYVDLLEENERLVKFIVSRLNVNAMLKQLKKALRAFSVNSTDRIPVVQVKGEIDM